MTLRKLKVSFQKHKQTTIIVSCIFFTLMLAASTEGALSSSASLQSYGTLAYAQPTPTPAPAPNEAALNDGNWYTDTTWAKCPTLDVYSDTSTTHQGESTFRVEPDMTSAGNAGADHWGPSVKPGDHIVMSCWIKTGGVTPVSYAGARIGFDIYGAQARICGVQSVQQASDGCRTPSTDISVEENYVHWGSDWTLRTWDFIMPSTYISDGGSAQISNNYAQGQAVAPTTIVPWLQVWDVNYPNGAYTCWFSDFTLNINP
jgi:hypothetical protein